MNIVEFLEENGVPVSAYGKNVSAGWIGIQCLFCDDTTNHLGIRLSDYKTHCWKCGGNSIYSVVQEIAEVNFKKAKKIIKSLDILEVPTWTRPDVRKKEQLALRRNFLPKEASKQMLVMHKEYLEERGFYPRLTARKYELLFAGTVGRYKFRIIIPYYYHGLAYTFTARSVVEGVEKKYDQPRRDSVPMTAKEMIYNIDNLKPYHDCVLCEGVTDTWKFGDGAVATSGLGLSPNQLKLLISKNIRNLFISFDNDTVKDKVIKQKRTARRQAKETFRVIKPFVKHAEIVTPTVNNDIGEMTVNEALYVRQILKFDKGL